MGLKLMHGIAVPLVWMGASELKFRFLGRMGFPHCCQFTVSVIMDACDEERPYSPATGVLGRFFIFQNRGGMVEKWIFTRRIGDLLTFIWSGVWGNAEGAWNVGISMGRRCFYSRFGILCRDTLTIYIRNMR